MVPAIVILIVLLLSALALRHLQRAFFYPVPGAMPSSVDEGVTAMLTRFETALAEHAPDVLANLQPGLTERDVRAIEARHRLKLTDEMRALYQWRNGAARDEVIELIPGHRFVPLEDA